MPFLLVYIIHIIKLKGYENSSELSAYEAGKQKFSIKNPYLNRNIARRTFIVGEQYRLDAVYMHL